MDRRPSRVTTLTAPPRRPHGRLVRAGGSGSHLLVAVAAIWGLSFVAVAWSLESFTPWVLRAVTFLGGALVLAGLAVARRLPLGLPRPRDAWHLVVAGAFNIAGFGALSALALLNTTAGRAGVCLYLMPVWVAPLSRLVLGERLGRAGRVAVLAGVAGLVVLLLPLLRSGLSAGALAATGAGLSWALGTVYLKWARVPAHPLTVTVWQLTAGGALSIIGAVLWDEGLPSHVTTHAWLGIAYSIAIGAAVAYPLWFRAVASIPASAAGLGTLLVPVFGMLASVTLLAERPTSTDLAGFVLVLVAGLLALPTGDTGAVVRPSLDHRRHR